MANKIYGYTVVCWPESMPDEWKRLLNALPFGYAMSLHDKDVDANGELKKAHMHIYFQGKPSKRQKDYIHKALGIEYGEDVKSPKGMYDYLTHENNPEKYHYAKDNIQYSAKWSQELFECDCAAYAEKEDKTQELIEYILGNALYEYSDLMISLIKDGRRDLIKSAKCNAAKWFIDSMRNKVGNHGKK